MVTGAPGNNKTPQTVACPRSFRDRRQEASLSNQNTSAHSDRPVSEYDNASISRPGRPSTNPARFK
jgi:hypothetical protein